LITSNWITVCTGLASSDVDVT